MTERELQAANEAAARWMISMLQPHAGWTTVIEDASALAGPALFIYVCPDAAHLWLAGRADKASVLEMSRKLAHLSDGAIANAVRATTDSYLADMDNAKARVQALQCAAVYLARAKCMTRSGVNALSTPEHVHGVVRVRQAFNHVRPWLVATSQAALIDPGVIRIGANQAEALDRQRHPEWFVR